MRNVLRKITAAGFAFSIMWLSVTGVNAADDFKSAYSPKHNATVNLQSANRKYVTLSGIPFGIRMYTDGVVVVGVEEVETASGTASPARKAKLQKGDVILKINNEKIESNMQAYNIFKNSGGRTLKLRLRRGGEERDACLTPVKSETDGKYRAGLWIRDSTAGLGTLTFYDKDTKSFAGLGHAVCDIDTGETMPLRSGDIAPAFVTGCYRGKRGEAGELCGILSDETLGKLEKNTNTGVYGTMIAQPQSGREIPVASKSEVHTGRVQILTTIDGNLPQYYDAEITRIYANRSNSVKNFVVEVTDKNLISKTGGIVQGMSGSPIIQDGRLAGAITHVFVNNPLQGYGIYAETMVNDLK